VIDDESEASVAFKELIRKGRIFVGQKLNLVNQSACDSNLQLNYNGFYPAHYKAKLGIAKKPMILRNLKALKAHSIESGVSMIDFIVIRRYPLYQIEVDDDQRKARHFGEGDLKETTVKAI
jgi:hypothetical protein